LKRVQYLSQSDGRAEQFAWEVLAGQLRPKAEIALHDRRYGEAAQLLSQIERVLTPAERKKLAIAKTRSV